MGARPCTDSSTRSVALCSLARWRRCGLVKAVHRFADGKGECVEWVAPKQKEAFEKKGAKLFAKRAKRAKPTTKAEQGGRSSKDERSPSTAASSGRTTRTRSNSKLERDGVVRAFLTDSCELSTSDSQAYTEALAAEGFDSVEAIALMDTDEWPPMVLKGHRKRVKAEAQRVVAEKLAQKAAAKQASPCPCL